MSCVRERKKKKEEESIEKKKVDPPQTSYWWEHRALGHPIRFLINLYFGEAIAAYVALGTYVLLHSVVFIALVDSLFLLEFSLIYRQEWE